MVTASTAVKKKRTGGNANAGTMNRAEMKLSITGEQIANRTGFLPGSRGYFATEENPVIVIGEDDTHVWTILERGGTYYGIFKAPENLSALHITALPKEPLPRNLSPSSEGSPITPDPATYDLKDQGDWSGYAPPLILDGVHRHGRAV